MSKLVLSKLFRRQIKIVARRDQKKFLDICNSWDRVHKTVDNMNIPFSKIKFKSQVEGRQLYLFYDFDRRKDEFWVSGIYIKTSDGFKVYRP